MHLFTQRHFSPDDVGGTPEVPETETPEAALDVQEIDGEPEVQEAAEVEEVIEAASLDDILNDVYGELGDTAEQPEAFKRILEKPEALKRELEQRGDDPIVKSLIAEVRRLKAEALKQGQSSAATREATLDEREAALVVKENDFVSQQAAFAKIADDPKFKELLTAAEGEVEPDDVQGLIAKGIAEKFGAFMKPVVERNNLLKSQRRLDDVFRRNPRLRTDPKFKTRVTGLMKERREAGSPITADDAVALTKHAEASEKATAERQAKQASARKIGRRSGPSGGNAEKGVPAEIKRKGAYAIHKYLEANPDVARRIRAGAA